MDLGFEEFLNKVLKKTPKSSNFQENAVEKDPISCKRKTVIKSEPNTVIKVVPMLISDKIETEQSESTDETMVDINLLWESIDYTLKGRIFFKKS